MGILEIILIAIGALVGIYALLFIIWLVAALFIARSLRF